MMPLCLCSPYKMRSPSLSPLFVVLLFSLLSYLICLAAGEETCDVEGSCPSEEGEHREQMTRGSAIKEKDSSSFVPGVCSTSTSIYSQGGTAQAYKPNAPLSSTVCSPEIAKSFKYKPASWNLSRSNNKQGSAPQLDITLKFLSCSNSEDNDCICQQIVGPAVSSNIVEVWQAFPDGTYSSLRKSNECRAQVQVDQYGEARFSTVAPGSSGVMGGLGPSGWDWTPFGPPVIHILAHVTGHEPLLLDLPALFRPKTLTERGFVFGDWRGIGWLKQRPASSVMTLSSWEPNVEENSIKIEFEISLQKSESSGNANLCEHMLGLPSSFFLEPITVCSPSTLDFFAL